LIHKVKASVPCFFVLAATSFALIFLIRVRIKIILNLNLGDCQEQCG
jgi:hypothetical protein